MISRQKALWSSLRDQKTGALPPLISSHRRSKSNAHLQIASTGLLRPYPRFFCYRIICWGSAVSQVNLGVMLICSNMLERNPQSCHCEHSNAPRPQRGQHQKSTCARFLLPITSPVQQTNSFPTRTSSVFPQRSTGSARTPIWVATGREPPSTVPERTPVAPAPICSAVDPPPSSMMPASAPAFARVSAAT